MKKDIITITGLTTVDGSVLTVGAHIALEIEFPIQFDGYNVNIRFFRNKQIYENGYESLRILNFEDNYSKINTEDITVSEIYSEAVNYINGQFDSPVCEIVN